MPARSSTPRVGAGAACRLRRRPAAVARAAARSASQPKRDPRCRCQPPVPTTSCTQSTVDGRELVEVLVADRERRHQHDDVAERADQHAALGGRAGRPRSRYAEPRDATSMPVIVPQRRTSTHAVAACDSGASSAPSRSPTRAACCDRLALGHQLEVGQRGRAGQRVGRCRCGRGRRCGRFPAPRGRRRRPPRSPAPPTAAGSRPVTPLPQVSRSGATPACSTAHIVPVRPMPVATSSAIISAPAASRQLAARRAGTSASWVSMPAGGLHHRLDDHGADLRRLRRRAASRSAASAVGGADRDAGDGIWRVSSRIGRYVAWNVSMPPTLTAPSVSPW